MKCPRCVEQGLRSQVTPGISSTTAMACHPFYDEDGVYHHHDFNTTTQQMRCSNGHDWSRDIPKVCPAPACDWNDRP